MTLVAPLAERAQELKARYPKGRERSALIPLLHSLQERDGYVSAAGMEEVAGLLNLTAAQVRAVASFYTMFHKQPKGRHVISVCHTISCMMAGAEDLIGALEDHLNVKCPGTTADGAFTLERAECLAACDLAPMMQIDYMQMCGPLSAEEAVALVELTGQS